jgi:hypothetical protein
MMEGDRKMYTLRSGVHRAVPLGIVALIFITAGLPEQGDFNPWLAGTGILFLVVMGLVYDAATVKVSPSGLEHRRLYGYRACYPWDTIVDIGTSRAAMSLTGSLRSTVTVTTNAGRRVERGLTGTATTGEALGETDAVVEWLNRTRRHFNNGSVEPIPDPPPRKRRGKPTNAPRKSTSVRLDARERRLRHWALALAILDVLVLLTMLLTAVVSIDTLIRPDLYPGNSEVATYLGFSAAAVGVVVLSCALVAVRGRLRHLPRSDEQIDSTGPARQVR